MQNGGCGFVLRPKFMFEDGYNPYEPKDPKDAVSLGVRVLAARYLEFSICQTSSAFQFKFQIFGS